MQERATKSQEQWNPIEAAIDGDAEERYAAADVHRISRPCIRNQSARSVLRCIQNNFREQRISCGWK